jgi:hypothetical protein
VASFTVYTLNRVLSKVSPITPYEGWHNKRPDVPNLRVFGSIAYVHIPKAERRKLGEKSIRCIFVGYSETQKAYRFLEPETRKGKISRDATFDKHHRLTHLPDEVQHPAQQVDRPPLPDRIQEEIITTAADNQHQKAREEDEAPEKTKTLAPIEHPETTDNKIENCLYHMGRRRNPSQQQAAGHRKLQDRPQREFPN